MSNINYNVEAFGYVLTEVPSKTSKTDCKAFADKVYAEADRIYKENKADYSHIEPFDTYVTKGQIGIKFSVFPEEYEDEDVYIDGAYFDSSFGNYLPNEKVCRTIVWNFDSAEAELLKMSDLLDKFFPEDGDSLNDSCFVYDTDDLPEPPAETEYDEADFFGY